MGYLHIDNLYHDQTILMFKQVYALEKIHGTSSNILYYPIKNNVECLNFFSGGEKEENFKKCFDEIKLTELLRKFAIENNLETSIQIFGEAYGGKQQGMSRTYGKELKFIVFDVKIGYSWLNVLKAEEITKQLGLEFVHYDLITTDIETLDKYRDMPSIQARRNNVDDGDNPKPREGIVLRPIEEFRINNGVRVIAKHKSEIFAERQHQPKVTKNKLEVLTEANKIADEFVTQNRLMNILSHIKEEEHIIENTGRIIKLFIEDINLENRLDCIGQRDVIKIIGKKSAELYKKYIVGKYRNEK